MNEQWKLVDRLFHEIADLPADERKRFIEMFIGADASLRLEVESLLASDGGARDFLETPALGDQVNALSALPLEESPDDSSVGQLIGPYRIERQIASGGMSVVYLGVRADGHYEQQVAVKLIKRGMDTDQILRRFLQERQTLANLDHPNIAKLLDGGVAEDGRPYLVIEFVAGVPIDRYCDQKRLSVSERIALFETVCAAVHYAHQNLVIHRDLKPANILVTQNGVPKLLDFGVAKVLSDTSGNGSQTLTAMASRMLTPEYASPEQLCGRPMTTASDVYSLGVVLYELLSGHRPHQLRQLSRKEIERLVCEADPEKPSSAIGRLGPRVGEALTGAEITPQSVSSLRRASPEGLRRRLRGDLDNIVLMAMRKDPHRRYASAEQFCEDLRRHRTGLPVSARKDTVWYRTTKLVKRNKVGFAAAVMIVMSLLTGAMGIVWKAHEAQVQRDVARTNLTRAEHAEQQAKKAAEQANAKAEVARQALEFMQDLFGPPRVASAYLQAPTAQSILDHGAERLEQTESTYDPALRATLMDVIGWSYMKLGLFDRAQTLFDQGLALRLKQFGESHTDVLDSLESLGTLNNTVGNFKEAIRYREWALEISRKLGGPDSMMVVIALSNLGIELAEVGQDSEAERLFSEAMEISRRAAPRGPKDKWDNARIFLLNNLASERAKLGRHDEAEPLFREALALIRQIRGDDAPSVADALENLGIELMRQRRLDEADDLMEQALSMRKKLFGPDNVMVAQSLNSIAVSRYARGDYDATLEYCRQALAIRREKLPPDAPQIAESETLLAACLIRLGRFEEAEELLLASFSVLEESRTLDSPRTRVTLGQIIKLYQLWGKPEKAEAWKARMSAQVDARVAGSTASHPSDQYATSLKENGEEPER
ncbi:MAG: serine/threonine protein kinase [Phycisphaerales bacterium]|nr:serine/threonine protein kinase [Phycisphaerales bacterium]MCB9854439.1 serine/threonine protein kinase [Phycisphaerales bacterium]